MLQNSVSLFTFFSFFAYIVIIFMVALNPLGVEQCKRREGKPSEIDPFHLMEKELSFHLCIWVVWGAPDPLLSDVMTQSFEVSV
jgi:hypothetical protein